MIKEKMDLVAWEPQLTADELLHVQKLRGEIGPQIALMRAVRKKLKLTQQEVAEALGVTQSNVSKMEAVGDPTLSVLARMALARGKCFRLTLESADGHEEASFKLSSAA